MLSTQSLHRAQSGDGCKSGSLSVAPRRMQRGRGLNVPSSMSSSAKLPNPLLKGSLIPAHTHTLYTPAGPMQGLGGAKPLVLMLSPTGSVCLFPLPFQGLNLSFVSGE